MKFRTFYTCRKPVYEKPDPTRIVDQLYAPTLAEYAERALRGHIAVPDLQYDETKPDMSSEGSLKDYDRSMAPTDRDWETIRVGSGFS